MTEPYSKRIGLKSIVAVVLMGGIITALYGAMLAGQARRLRDADTEIRSLRSRLNVQEAHFVAQDQVIREYAELTVRTLEHVSELLKPTPVQEAGGLTYAEAEAIVLELEARDEAGEASGTLCPDICDAIDLICSGPHYDLCARLLFLKHKHHCVCD